MKAQIIEGKLVVEYKNETEKYALEQWYKSVKITGLSDHQRMINHTDTLIPASKLFIRKKND